MWLFHVKNYSFPSCLLLLLVSWKLYAPPKCVFNLILLHITRARIIYNRNFCTHTYFLTAIKLPKTILYCVIYFWKKKEYNKKVVCIIIVKETFKIKIAIAFFFLKTLETCLWFKSYCEHYSNFFRFICLFDDAENIEDDDDDDLHCYTCHKDF